MGWRKWRRYRQDVPDVLRGVERGELEGEAERLGRRWHSDGRGMNSLAL